MVTPIFDALDITRAALDAAFAPIVPPHQGQPACYWKRGPVITSALLLGQLASCLIYQSQDGGGRAEQWLGEEGWSGEITVKCISANEGTAATLRDNAFSALQSLSAPGYSISAVHVRPLDLPQLDEGLTTLANIYRITISKE
jgi:hypothetical protein